MEINKRINFLLDTLREISHKKDLSVFIDDPKFILKEQKFAVTYACVPKYRDITSLIKPAIEFPSRRLAEPISFYPKSYSSWKKKIKLSV